jgi:hypothetical protein
MTGAAITGIECCSIRRAWHVPVIESTGIEIIDGGGKDDPHCGFICHGDHTIGDRDLYIVEQCVQTGVIGLKVFALKTS